MQKMSEEEFNDRMEALARAGRIFPDVINVTERFKLYQEVFADRERQLFLNANVEGNRNRTPMDSYDRPKCVDCQADMMFRVVPENEEGVKTQLVCSSCNLVLDSDKTIQDWMQVLKKNV